MTINVAAACCCAGGGGGGGGIASCDELFAKCSNPTIGAWSASVDYAGVGDPPEAGDAVQLNLRATFSCDALTLNLQSSPMENPNFPPGPGLQAWRTGTAAVGYIEGFASVSGEHWGEDASLVWGWGTFSASLTVFARIICYIPVEGIPPGDLIYRLEVEALRLPGTPAVVDSRGVQVSRVNLSMRQQAQPTLNQCPSSAGWVLPEFFRAGGLFRYTDGSSIDEFDEWEATTVPTLSVT